MSGGLRPGTRGTDEAGATITERDWLRPLNDSGVAAPGGMDVGKAREARRRRRLWWLAALLATPLAFLTYRLAVGRPFNVFALPHLPEFLADPVVLLQVLFMLLLIVGMVGFVWFLGRSPHVLLRPEQLDVRLDDVVGIEPVKAEVVRSLNLFLAHRTYAAKMGGRPRRGLLFEGPPGTGKTYLAKSMAAEAGVPFLFVSATAFQSSFAGATTRKIRAYFKALRAAARREGGAIGFIEEFDALGTARSHLAAAPAPGAPSSGQTGWSGWSGCQTLPAGLSASAAGSGGWAAGSGGRQVHPTMTESAASYVNELLVQMQSFDTPTGWQRVTGAFIGAANLLLPAHRQLPKPAPTPANVLLIAATNRAEALDPALTRPGRFDRRLSFERPPKSSRRALVDHFLARKAHEGDLDDSERRDALAALTTGYTPAMIENLFDEALINAVRRGATAMTGPDVEHARLLIEVGLGNPVDYTDHERELIATHESGHAVTAWLLAPHRRLEVLSIVKRRDALGLLAHGDRDDVYTRGRDELLALIHIALGGHVAETLFYGEVSTGPASDLSQATGLACQMVGAAGMSDSLVSFAAVTAGSLTDTNLVGRVLADQASRTQVETLLADAHRKVTTLLSGHRSHVTALRDALLARHELLGNEITDVLDTVEAPAVVDVTDPADGDHPRHPAPAPAGCDG
jgi:cell division protease FtsH